MKRFQSYKYELMPTGEQQRDMRRRDLRSKERGGCQKADLQAEKTSAEIAKLVDDADIEALNMLLAELANAGPE